MRPHRESEEQVEKMVNDLRSGKGRKDSQKRETKPKHPKRSGQPGSPGSECFKGRSGSQC